MDIAAQVYYSLREVFDRDRISVNAKVAGKGETRGVRVPVGVLDSMREHFLIAFDCRLTPSKYKGERVRRMARLLKGAHIVEVAGLGQAEHAGMTARALLGDGA